MSAVATSQGGKTVAEAAPAQSLVIQAADERLVFYGEFTAGRQGLLVIGDEFASGHHARFTTAHSLWYVEDLGSTKGTWLNGRRIHASQRLKKGKVQDQDRAHRRDGGLHVSHSRASPQPQGPLEEAAQVVLGDRLGGGGTPRRRLAGPASGASSWAARRCRSGAASKVTRNASRGERH